jgi:hypothetical protein
MQDLNEALSTWIARVDEFDLGIIPGSLEFTPGKNKRDVTKEDNGDLTFTEDPTEAVGMIKFEVRNTASNLEKVNIIENRKKVTVKIFTPDGTVDKVMRIGTSTNNDPTRTSGSDAKIPLEFKGTSLE